MTTPTTRSDHPVNALAIPSHLARYAAEVETWRLEALAYRASRENRTDADR